MRRTAPPYPAGSPFVQVRGFVRVSLPPQSAHLCAYFDACLRFQVNCTALSCAVMTADGIARYVGSRWGSASALFSNAEVVGRVLAVDHGGGHLSMRSAVTR